MSATLLPVFVSAWQIECCWEPLAVGNLIAWHLAFVEESDQHDPSRRGLVQLDASGVVFGGQGEPFEGRWALQLDVPLMSLYWMAPRRAVGPQQLAGFIHEDHHAEVPETFPVTYVIVRRIQVEEREYVPSAADARTSVPSSTPPTYREVETSPMWFARKPLSGAAVAVETGVLVEIELSTANAQSTSL
jgi:hypothetical protein